MVGTVTDDVRVYEVAKLRVVALRFTATARARIVKVSLLRLPPLLLSNCLLLLSCFTEHGKGTTMFAVSSPTVPLLCSI